MTERETHGWGTSWGTPDIDVDVRALRRYHNLLEQTAAIGEVLFFALLAGIVGASFYLLNETNFENTIFYDGTDVVCIYDGRTGEIVNVE